MRRQSYIYIITISMLALLVLPVSAHWAEPHAAWLVEKGYLKAGDSLLEDLDEPAVRGDIAKLAVSILGGEEEYPSEPMYTDVAEDNPYFTVCQKAGELGYIAGFEDGTFRPYDLVSRQDTFAILGRAFKITGGTQDIFIDSKEIGEYAKPYVNGLKEQGVVNGYPDGTVKPEGEITVGELLTIAHFLAEEQETKPEVTPTPTTTPTSVPTPVPTKPIGSGSGPGGNSRPSPTPTPTVKPEGPKIQIEKIMEEYVDEETGEKTGESVKPIELTVKPDKPDEVEEIRWMRLSEPEGDRTYEEIWKSNGSELLDGNRLEVRKNGRYLFCVTGKNGGKTYIPQDVTEIYRPRFNDDLPDHPAIHQYSNHWEEYVQVSVLGLKVNNQLSNESNTPKYKLYWGKYADLSNGEHVYINDAVEKEIAQAQEFDNQFNVRENGRYNLYVQDQWGNCGMYTFEINETYTPKIKAELQPRASNTEQAVINLKYDGNIKEKTWLIYRYLNGAYAFDINKDKWFYMQQINHAAELSTDTLTVKRSGIYGFYAKDVDGNIDVVSVEVDIARPKIINAKAEKVDKENYKVTFDVETVPNRKVVKKGYLTRADLPNIGSYNDINYYVEKNLNKKEFVTLEENSFMLTERELILYSGIFIQDEWGNCDYLLTKEIDR